MWIFSQTYRSFKGLAQGPAPRGFTLIELLVVITIMVLITGFLLFRQSKFDSSTLLRSLAYSVALSARTAQVYGTSVLGTSTPTCVGNGISLSGTCFSAAYGLYFCTNSDPLCPNQTGINNQYYLFADTKSTGKFDPVEIVKTYTLGPGYVISNFGATTTILGNPVLRSVAASGLSNLTFIFKRANPDACIATSNSADACGSGAGENYSAAFVQIQASGASGESNSTRSINISTTGQIAVGVAGT